MPAEGAYVIVARVATIYWFLYLLVLAPVIGLVEKPARLPVDIHEYEEMKRSGEIRFLPFRLISPSPSEKAPADNGEAQKPVPAE